MFAVHFYVSEPGIFRSVFCTTFQRPPQPFQRLHTGGTM